MGVTQDKVPSHTDNALQDATDAERTLVAEISPAAVTKNLKLLRSGLEPGTKLCPVVKADAYGLGLSLLLPAIVKQADALAVATGPEALAVRRFGYTGPVLILFPSAGLGPSESVDKSREELIAAGVTWTVFHPGELPPLAAAGRRVGRTVEVHVMIDTGMFRGGVPWQQAPALVKQARATEGIRLTGLYTHFATADERDKQFARQQFERFVQTAKAIGGREELSLHAANSAATIDLPETHLDMVRPGISVYGYQPSDQMHRTLPLAPALRLWGRLMQVKDAPQGSACGYGLTHTFARNSRIGLVPVGYADGYFRSLSNQATMRIAGCDVPVVGRVSMDQTIVDLTDAPHVQVAEEVEIYSNDPAASHSVENIARRAGTICYEVISRLGPRARRVAV